MCPTRTSPATIAVAGDENDWCHDRKLGRLLWTTNNSGCSELPYRCPKREDSNPNKLARGKHWLLLLVRRSLVHEQCVQERATSLLSSAQCAGFFRAARAITLGRLVASPLFNRNGVIPLYVFNFIKIKIKQTSERANHASCFGYVSQDYTTLNCLKNDC